MEALQRSQIRGQDRPDLGDAPIGEEDVGPKLGSVGNRQDRSGRGRLHWAGKRASCNSWRKLRIVASANRCIATLSRPRPICPSGTR